MTHSQLEVQEIDGLQAVEHCKNDTSSSQTSDLKSKLLHHLVELSHVVEKKELLKANNELVNELNSAIELAANALKNEQVIWSEQLVQKLIDAKVEPSCSDQIVNYALSLSRNEGKVTFEIDTKNWPADYKFKVKSICLRDLDFKIYLYYGKTYPGMYIYIDCKKIPANKSCKTQIRVAIKNHSDQPDWVRHFNKVYTGKTSTHRQFSINSLIESEEYADESFGLLKDGMLTIEMAIQADELVELKNETPATTTVMSTPTI